MVMCTYTFNTPKTEEKLQVHDQPELYNKIQYQIMKKFQMTNVMLYLSQLHTQEKKLST